MTVSYVKLTA